MKPSLSIVGSCIALVLACSDAEPEAAPLAGSAGSAGAPAGQGGAGGAAGASSTTGGDGASVSGGSGGNAGMQPASDGSGGTGAAPDGGASGDGGSDAGMSSARGTGPGDWTAGDYPADLMNGTFLEIAHGDQTRTYGVHVPPSYDPDVPMPAVFCIHGLGQDAVLFCMGGAGMPATSDASDFILIMPNGSENSWNAGTCCGGASTNMLDDVALFRAIFEEVGTHVNIDLDRVYATGLSNGGYMSYRLACEAADIFRAVAPGAGAIGMNDIGGGTNPTSDMTECEPSRPISVMHVHGTDDFLIPYELQAQSLEHIALKNGCTTMSVTSEQDPNGGDTTCIRYEGCPDGIEVVGCSIEGGGHCWFGSPDCGTGAGDAGSAIVGANSDTMKNNEAIWAFFERNGL